MGTPCHALSSFFDWLPPDLIFAMIKFTPEGYREFIRGTFRWFRAKRLPEVMQESVHALLREGNIDLLSYMWMEKFPFFGSLGFAAQVCTVSGNVRGLEWCLLRIESEGSRANVRYHALTGGREDIFDYLFQNHFTPSWSDVWHIVKRRSIFSPSHAKCAAKLLWKLRFSRDYLENTRCIKKENSEEWREISKHLVKLQT